MRNVIVGLLLVFIGCNDSAEAPEDAGPAEDLRAPFFEPERLLDIQIDLDPDDWDTLRAQHHDFFGTMVDNCPSGPPERPYDYVRATVTVDGEVLEDVAVRKKGFLGSITMSRPSLKLSFDEYVEDRRFHGLRRMTLNNNLQDISQINTCLAYRVFRDAGVVAPRCNFARVTVNGEDLGIFSHVESIKRPFLGRSFGSSEGNLYEGALADFRPIWVENYEEKGGNNGDRSDLEALVEALEAPDDELLDALEPILDIDAFLTFWATELLVGHWDGFNGDRNNHYIYRDPATGQFHFIPWGADSCFGDENPFLSFTPPDSVWANNLLSHRLYNHPEIRGQYQQRLQTLLDTVWNEAELLAEIDRLEALIGPHVSVPQEAFAADIERVRVFVDEQRDRLEADLAEDPDWEFALPSEYCLLTLGTVTGTFSAPYGPFPSDNPFSRGTGTMEVTYGDEVMGFLQVGATVGPDGDPSHPRLGIAIVGLRDDNSLLIPSILVEPELYEAPVTLDVNGYDAFGVLMFSELFGETQLVAFSRGELTLEQAPTDDGGMVSGSFSLEFLGMGSEG